MIREVLLPLPSWPERPTDEALQSSVAAAKALGAGMTALGFDIEFHAPSSILADVFLDISGMVSEAKSRSAAYRKNMKLSLDTSAAKAGVALRHKAVHCMSSEIFDRAAEAARLHDLTLIAWGGSDADRVYLGETVFFASGRPVLVLPPDERAFPRAFRRIIVAWDGGCQAARAMADALPLLKAAEQVRVITVRGEKSVPISESLDEVKRHLGAHEVEVVTELVDAKNRQIGAVFADQAREHGSDLLVMGAFGHSRFREIVLGGATQSMLEEPPIPVLLSH
jgi:nucleotide-binding universal stress UspA family protein